MQAAEDLPLIEAQRFVDCFTKYYQQVIMAQTDAINIVWEHNIMFMAASFVETYRQFRDSGKPTEVLLAYHYTDSANLKSIEYDGLMPKPERIQAGIDYKNFGLTYENTARAELPSACRFLVSIVIFLSHILFLRFKRWGPGIYCCHDPLSTAAMVMGDTGILVAILRGTTRTSCLGSSTAENSQVEHEYDTVVTSTHLSNKVSWSIMKTGRQVLPLVLLPKDFVQNNPSQLQEFHTGLRKIMDEFFNNGRATSDVTSQPSCRASSEQPPLKEGRVLSLSSGTIQVAEDLPLLEAQRFVEHFTEYFQLFIMAQTDEIKIAWKNTIMFMAESFVETYRQFRDSGKPTQVMLAYHYTDSANLNSIECNGLMSKPERIQAGIECQKFSGESYEKSAPAELPAACRFRVSHFVLAFQKVWSRHLLLS
jgi:hypothetical protein